MKLRQYSKSINNNRTAIMSSNLCVSFAPEPDNEDEEFILLKYHKMIDFVDSENARATREIAEANRFVRYRVEKEDENTRKVIKMILKAGFTAGVMNQHFVNGDFEDGCKYYDKYVETLSDCDEFLSENFAEGKYLDCINHLNGDRKNYEKLKNLNQEKFVVQKALNHLMTHPINQGIQDVFLD